MNHSIVVDKHGKPTGRRVFLCHTADGDLDDGLVTLGKDGVENVLMFGGGKWMLYTEDISYELERATDADTALDIAMTIVLGDIYLIFD